MVISDAWVYGHKVRASQLISITTAHNNDTTGLGSKGEHPAIAPDRHRFAHLTVHSERLHYNNPFLHATRGCQSLKYTLEPEYASSLRLDWVADCMVTIREAAAGTRSREREAAHTSTLEPLISPLFPPDFSATWLYLYQAGVAKYCESMDFRVPSLLLLNYHWFSFI